MASRVAARSSRGRSATRSSTRTRRSPVASRSPSSASDDESSTSDSASASERSTTTRRRSSGRRGAAMRGRKTGGRRSAASGAGPRGHKSDCKCVVCSRMGKASGRTSGRRTADRNNNARANEDVGVQVKLTVDGVSKMVVLPIPEEINTSGNIEVSDASIKKLSAGGRATAKRSRSRRGRMSGAC